MPVEWIVKSNVTSIESFPKRAIRTDRMELGLAPGVIEQTDARPGSQSANHQIIFLVRRENADIHFRIPGTVN